DAFFEQRRAQPLHYATPDLLVDQLRIDDGAAIFNDPMSQQLDEAGLGVNLEPRGLDAVGEGEWIFSRYEVARRHQFGLDARRQRVGTEINNPGKLFQFDARRPVIGVHDAITADVEFGRSGLQDRSRNIEDGLAQRLGSLKRRLAADTRATRGPGAAAIGRVVGVAKNDANAFH